jgi:hypothetical protein
MRENDPSAHPRSLPPSLTALFSLSTPVPLSSLYSGPLSNGRLRNARVRKGGETREKERKEGKKELDPVFREGKKMNWEGERDRKIP